MRRVLFVIKKLITKYSILYFRSWKLRPRWACGFPYVVVLAGTSEELAGSRVIEGTCIFCGTEWSYEIDYSRYSSLRWRRGRRASCLNLKIILPCLRLLSLSTRLCLYILHTYITCLSLHAWYSFMCLYLFELREQLSTSILNQKESWGEVLEPFTGNSASLFDYHLCISFT